MSGASLTISSSIATASSTAPVCSFEAREELSRGEIARVNLERAREVDARVVEVLRAAAQTAEHEIRFEVVGIDGDFAPKGLLRCGGVADAQQRSAIRRIQRGQARVELHRFLELFLRRRIRQLVQVGDGEQQMRFGRVAGAEDAVDVALPVVLVVGLEQRHAQHVRKRQVVLEERLARLQQRDGVGRTACLQISSRRAAAARSSAGPATPPPASAARSPR